MHTLLTTSHVCYDLRCLIDVDNVFGSTVRNALFYVAIGPPALGPPKNRASIPPPWIQKPQATPEENNKCSK